MTPEKDDALTLDPKDEYMVPDRKNDFPEQKDDCDQLLMPEVRDSLVLTIRRRDAQDFIPSRTLPRLSRRGVGVLATATVLASGTALAATTPWSPIVGGDSGPPPSIARTAIPSDQIAALAPLRREQTETDRSPEVQTLLKKLTSEITDGIHLDSIRTLDTHLGGVTILFAADHEATNQPGRPAEGKDNVLCMMVGVSASRAKGSGVGTSAGGRCGTLGELKRGKIFLGGQYGGRLELSGLVPDGVSRVSITLRTGATVNASVIHNSFRVDTAAPDGSYEDAEIHWYDDRGGEVVKRP